MDSIGKFLRGSAIRAWSVSRAASDSPLRNQTNNQKQQQNMGLDKHFLSYKDDRTGWNVRKSVESEDGGCGHRDEIVVEDSI